jgi:peptidoglycan/LPS O-acetylase OafA/YrhL
MDVEGRTAAEDALTHPKYRPDIDGLRAVAVLSVLAFHAFPKRVPGGFIGVDIFFVISGFLISTIIFKSLASREFSFLEFYSRRVRRIFPALVTVLVVAFVCGWFVLYPDEYRQLGKHVVGGAWFFSNFVLWRESGYFDNSAYSKPLLHLWSLGIEEQFYIFFPLFAWLVWKGRLNVLTLLILGGLASFLLNIRDVSHDAVRTFYMPQTRIWELMEGCVLALLVMDTSGWVGRMEKAAERMLNRVLSRAKADVMPAVTLSNVKAWIGTLLIAFGIWKITKEMHFPGKWALLPTLGAGLLIWAGPEAFLNRRILSHPILMWVGKISYPLYLWHWILLSYLYILAAGMPPGAVRAGALVVAVGLSWLTYQLVEKPLRFGEHGRRKTLLLIALMLSVSIVGFADYKTKGFQALRHNTAFKGVEQFAWPYMGNPPCVAKVKTQPGFCMQLGNPDLITIGILGDSTANALVPGVAKLVESHGEGLINIGHGACPPVQGLVPTTTWGYHPNCPEIVDDAYRVILAEKNIKTVILGLFTNDIGSWGLKNVPANATLQQRFDISMALLDSDIRKLNAAGKNVILTYDAAFSPVSSEDCLNRPFSALLKQPRHCDVTENQLINRYPYLRLLDDHFRGRKDVCIFRQSQLLFSNGHLNLIDPSGIPFLRDSHHLSVYGSGKMGQWLAKSNCASQLPWRPAAQTPRKAIERTDSSHHGSVY